MSDKYGREDELIEIKESEDSIYEKIRYYDTVLKSESGISIKTIAQEYGLTAQRLNKILKEEKVQYKEGKHWLLYKKYKNSGYTIIQTYERDGRTFHNMYWTENGRNFIYNLLKDKLDISPIR